MTNKDIEELLNHLNLQEEDEPFTIYKYEISATVEVAKVWHINFPTATQFFLIRICNFYVGAINILSNDLHWYILPEHRKKGYLTNALKTYILPYLFEIKGVEKQQITITNNNSDNDYVSSLSVAKKIGFKPEKNNGFSINKSDLQYSFSKSKFKYSGLNDIECKKLTDELGAISTRLEQIQTRIEYAFGLNSKDYQEPDLKELAVKIKSRQWTIQDMLLDFNKVSNT